METPAFLPGWPSQGYRHHQLCQPVKWASLRTPDYMECKTLEKCVWNIRVTCFRWQRLQGWRGTSQKGKTLTSDFVWRHCIAHKWAGILCMAPTAVHLLGRIQAGWKDICFPQGQMKQNSQAFVSIPFGGKVEKGNLLKGRSSLGPQLSHKNSLVCFSQRPLSASHDKEHRSSSPRWRNHKVLALNERGQDTHTNSSLAWQKCIINLSGERPREVLWLIQDNEDRAGQRCLRRAWHRSTIHSVKTPFLCLTIWKLSRDSSLITDCDQHLALLPVKSFLLTGAEANPGVIHRYAHHTVLKLFKKC